MLKVLDLFSGIGGFSLGLESTGHFETIAFCEKDKFCQKVLKKNFKDIPIIGDIRDVKGSEFKADVITGGFPCQSISIAGKQKGKDDDRYLFPEMLKVIKEVKPRWIIGENVQNLINISNGTILKEIIEGLETENYEVQCFSISASSQGAWHKRERIWIVANSKCYKRQDTSTRQSRASKLWRFYSAKEEQTSHDLWSKTSRCNAPFGQDSWWNFESRVRRIPHGLSKRMDRFRKDRIKALGNSIVPQIAREIGKAIIEAENV